MVVQPPATGNSWLGVTEQPLPVGAAHDWSVVPSCGAVVVFTGTVRDHATDERGVERTGVTSLAYEAYDEHVVPALAAIEDELRRRWPTSGRVVMLHRVGRLGLGDVAVVVAVSAPHRGEAFEAARYAIDALKASAPIWKHETWSDGADWGTGASSVTDPSQVHGVAS